MVYFKIILINEYKYIKGSYDNFKSFEFDKKKPYIFR